MVNFHLFPFFRLRRHGRSRYPKAKNILDLPYTKYNQRTMLPDSIPIGGKEVAPFVSIDEMLDHISLLSAFHKQRAVVHDFHQYCLSAANDFLDWASAQPYPSKPGTPVEAGTLATPPTPPIPATAATAATSATPATPSIPASPATPATPATPASPASSSSSSGLLPDPAPVPTEADAKPDTEAEADADADDKPPTEASDETLAEEPAPAAAPAPAPAPKPPRYPAEWSRRPEHADELLGLPPSLGAVMAWHACLLNPKLYDTEVEKYPGMIGKRFHMKATANAIRSGAIPVEPDPGFGDVGPYISRYYPSEDNLPSATTFPITPEPDGPDSDYDPDEHAYGQGPAYDLPTTFTEWDPLEIAAAIIRQMKFVDNMYRIGWLRADFFGADFGEGARQLVRGCVRYHAWLDLHSSVAGAHFFVPTLDIDLAWHTHQLHSGVLEYVKSPDIWGTTGTAGTYKADNLNVLGWFLGHDDTAGEDKLGNGLEATEKLWKEKFGWRYTY